MGASYYVLAAAEGSTHHCLLMAGNSHQIGNLSRKHTWVLPSMTSTGHSVQKLEVQMDKSNVWWLELLNFHTSSLFPHKIQLINIRVFSILTWRVMVDPTTGTAACGVSGTKVAGICPAACIALYCIGVMCSNPGGGTSQYIEGFLRRLFLPRRSPLPSPFGNLMPVKRKQVCK